MIDLMNEKLLKVLINEIFKNAFDSRQYLIDIKTE
jgi:hypothetical protein